MTDNEDLEKLYTNTTPFGLLSNEDRRLFVSHTDTGEWVFWNGRYWDKPKNWEPSWSDGIVYRLERSNPIPPSIDWEAVDKKWNWLAVDNDGEVFLHDLKPELLNTTESWETKDSWKHCRHITDTFSSFERGNMPWNETLISRPGVK